MDAAPNSGGPFAVVDCLCGRNSERQNRAASTTLGEAGRIGGGGSCPLTERNPNERALRKKIEALIADASVEELQRVVRVLRAMLEP